MQLSNGKVLNLGNVILVGPDHSGYAYIEMSNGESMWITAVEAAEIRRILLAMYKTF